MSMRTGTKLRNEGLDNEEKITQYKQLSQADYAMLQKG